MLRVSGEGTVLNYGVTFPKEFDVQEKSLTLKLYCFLSRYGLLTGSKVVLHQKLVCNMTRVTIKASGKSTLISVRSCDKFNNQGHF